MDLYTFRGSDADWSTGTCTITWVGNMTTWWTSWWPHCARSASPSCGWGPARRCWSGLSSTVLASTLSCGQPGSSPWSPLLRLRSAGVGWLLHFTQDAGTNIIFSLSMSYLQAAMPEATSRRIRAVFNTLNFWSIVLYNILALNSLDFAKLVAKRLLLKGYFFFDFEKR